MHREGGSSLPPGILENLHFAALAALQEQRPPMRRTYRQLLLPASPARHAAAVHIGAKGLPFAHLIQAAEGKIHLLVRRGFLKE